LQPGADLTGAFVIMFPGGVHDCAGGQKTASVQPQVQLGGGLDSVAAPRLPRPAGDPFLAVCLCRPGGFDCDGDAAPSPCSWPPVPSRRKRPQVDRQPQAARRVEHSGINPPRASSP
jgi:hypothetical protein